MSEPVIIKLVRHGLSESNTGEVKPELVGDFRIRLTTKGIEQAKATGKLIGADFLNEALLYRSPYTRTRQTMDNLLIGAGLDPASLTIYEDPRLREVDTGYEDYALQQKRREQHGWFYYRYSGGEAPTDCFDRMCTFLDSLKRQSKRKGVTKALIASHGMTIRCFVMRFLHLTVEEFESMRNPENCDVITIAHKGLLNNPQFTCGQWGVEGLRLRTEPESAPEPGEDDRGERK